MSEISQTHSNIRLEVDFLETPAKPAGRFSSMPHRLAGYVILGVILTVFVGKMYSSSSYDFLLAYSLLVSIVLFLQFFIALKRYKDPYLTAQEILKDQKTAGPPPLVSIMVAVKDEEAIIKRCLDSLQAQTYPNIEIIVVNDASSDGTRNILDFHKIGSTIDVVHLEKNVGKKRALAIAMWRAQGSIFAFTDSDSVLEPDAISKIASIFETDPGVGAVSGHCRALNAETNLITKIQDTWYEGQFSIRKAFESHYGAVTCVSGPLAVFRREAIFNFIPAWENDSFLGQEFRFATDRTITGFVLGSVAIGEKLKAKYSDSPFVTKENYPCRDWKIVYTKSAKAWTHVPDSFQRVFQQQIRWKKSFIRNMFFTGAFYWRKPLIVAGNYYLHVLFVLVGPIIALRHLIYLPIHGDMYSGILYLAGIAVVGFMFGFAYRTENQDSYAWIYRPLMSILSTIVLSWLVYYSALTIRKMVWTRN